MAELSSKSIESRALYFGGGSFLIAWLIGLFIFWGEYTPLFGLESIGVLSTLLATLVSFLAFLSSYNPPLKSQNKLKLLRNWVTLAALAFAHASIVFLIGVSVFFLVQHAFEGLLLDHWAASLITGITAGVSGYIIYLAGAKLTSVTLSNVLAIFLISGTLVSMITADNPYWWQMHFSSLGGGDTASALAFNLTLILGGIVIVGLSDFIASDFAKLQTINKKYETTKVNTIRLLLAGVGVLLAGVGLFVWNVYPVIHTYSAGGMVILFIYLIVGLPRLAPNFNRAFYIFSFSILTAVVICLWLWKSVGYLNITAFELLSFALIFGWLVIFVRQIAAGLEDTASARKRVT